MPRLRAALGCAALRLNLSRRREVAPPAAAAGLCNVQREEAHNVSRPNDSAKVYVMARTRPHLDVLGRRRLFERVQIN